MKSNVNLQIKKWKICHRSFGNWNQRLKISFLTKVIESYKHSFLIAFYNDSKTDGDNNNDLY